MMNCLRLVLAATSLVFPLALLAQPPVQTATMSSHELHLLIKSAHSSAEYTQLASYFHLQEQSITLKLPMNEQSEIVVLTSMLRSCRSIHARSIWLRASMSSIRLMLIRPMPCPGITITSLRPRLSATAKSLPAPKGSRARNFVRRLLVHGSGADLGR